MEDVTLERKGGTKRVFLLLIKRKLCKYRGEECVRGNISEREGQKKYCRGKMFMNCTSEMF